MPFTITDWNALVQAVNAKSDAFLGTYIVPISDLNEVEDPHKLKIRDMTRMRNNLRIMCDDGSLSLLKKYWSEAQINEIQMHIDTVLPCHPCSVVDGGEIVTSRDPEVLCFDSLGLNYGCEDRGADPLIREERLNAYYSNLAKPLVGEDESITLAIDAYGEWATLNSLVTPGTTESAMAAQVSIVNQTATTAWSTALSVYTERYDVEPVAPFIDLALTQQHEPIHFRLELPDLTFYDYWRWCKPAIIYKYTTWGCDVLGNPFITGIAEQKFRIAPNGLPILYDTFLGTSDDSIFLPSSVYVNPFQVSTERRCWGRSGSHDVFLTY